MYPDLKFMTNENDDIIFSPFSLEEGFELKGLPLISENLRDIENPLFFDFRDILLDANIENSDKEIEEILLSRETTDYNFKELYFYNSTPTTSNENFDIQVPSDLLRFIDLDIDEETLELEENLDTADLSDFRTNLKCHPQIIFEKIQKNNSNLLKVFDHYHIPYPLYKRILKKIIELSLIYSKEGCL